MKVCQLATGSKGNSSYFETDKVRFLVDIGLSCAQEERLLADIGVNADDIDFIFITHTHSDHTAGLKTFTKKHRAKVFLTPPMLRELKFDLPNYEFIGEELEVADLGVITFKTSHDVADSNGYVFIHKGRTAVYITDTGYLNKRVFDKITNRNLYIIESNHDVKMLREGPYPYRLQQRILSDEGHLSNKDTSYYLSQVVGPKTEKIVLIHLSESNNTPQLALSCLNETFERENLKLPEVVISYQHKRTEVYEV